VYRKEVEIKHKTGLHARPANEFVKKASSFKSNIWVEFRGKSINAKSIIGLLTAGISTGSRIAVYAEGQDEHEAVEALVELAGSDFVEEKRV